MSTGEIYALVDVNNFYVSCERAFDWKLNGRPVVVLSNNDGCAVARSNEVKTLGVKMGTPWHKLKDLAREHGIIALSSNYTLYGDMSRRVMTILGDLAPRLEVYSVDEAFLDCTGMRELFAHGQLIRKRILMWTGLPVCVGFASTKTLAKLANHCAKKSLAGADGVCDLTALDAGALDALLGRIEVGEVWGVGGKTCEKLQTMGIHSVLDLRQADIATIRSRFGVVLERTVRELRGESCLPLEMVAPDKQQIMCSRSFGRDVVTLDDLRQSVLTYVARAAEKLRRQQSLASSVMVFARTNPFKDVPQLSRQIVVPLPHPTDDTVMLSRAARAGIERIYAPGYCYKKSGTMLMGLEPKASRQVTLFEDKAAIERRSRLNETMDRINAKFGRRTVALAGAGIEKTWSMRANNVTPAYTTDWNNLPSVK